MNYKEIHEQIETLYDIAEYGVMPPKDKTPHKCYGLGEVGILFSGSEKVIVLDEIIDNVWTSSDELFNTFTRKKIEDTVMKCLRKCLISKIKPTIDDIKERVDELLILPVESYEVFRDLFGAIYNDALPLELGPYKIYNWELHKDMIKERYLHAMTFFTVFEMTRHFGFLISVHINSREPNRALEVADHKLKQFENIIRYMMGDTSGNHDIGIFTYKGRKVQDAFSLSPKNAGSNTTASGAILPVTIDDPYFRSDNGHDWIWTTIGKDTIGKYEKRILTAIEWVGKGVNDLDTAKAFVQYTFALEALFTFQEKNVLVNPSIASQLAEFSAFVASDNKNDRMRFENLIKKLYSIRSAIAHGGTKSVSKEQVNEYLIILKHLITRLITDAELSKITAIEQLNEWVKNRKYQ